MVGNGRYATWTPTLTKGERPLSIEVGGETYRLLEGCDDTSKYGFWLWCSAVALARYIAEQDLDGTTVVDVGAGLGLVGMVAVSRGARVTFVDSCTSERIAHNLALNGLSAAVESVDWSELKGSWDLGLASDVLYRDTGVVAVLQSRCDRVLIADGIEREMPGALRTSVPERQYAGFMWMFDKS